MQEKHPFPEKEVSSVLENMTAADLAKLRGDAARAYDRLTSELSGADGLPDFQFDLSVPADRNNFLPPVDVLMAFDRIRPGSVSRYFDLIEEEQASRHKRELEEATRPFRRRMDGYLVIFVLMGIAAACTLAGSISGAAAFIIAADLAFLVTVFGDRLPTFKR